MDINKINPELKAISSELYDINEKQELLRERKKELKVLMADGMGTAEVYRDANGTIEKICRKPKRIYDRDRLQAVLKKRGIPKSVIEDIIKQSTRRINVSEHLSVKVRRPK